VCILLYLLLLLIQHFFAIASAVHNPLVSPVLNWFVAATASALVLRSSENS
jgi:hypothetical protein